MDASGRLQAVDFSQSWVTITDASFNDYPGKVIVDAWSNSVSWNYQTANAETHPFICRKDGKKGGRKEYLLDIFLSVPLPSHFHPDILAACSPDKDVVNNVCSTTAASVQPDPPSRAWIAAAVLVPLLFLALLLFYFWKYQNGRYTQVSAEPATISSSTPSSHSHAEVGS